MKNPVVPRRLLLSPAIMNGLLLLLLLVDAASSLSTSSGRVAVVTGASRGIGRGIALELGRAGYTVYCLGRSTRASPSLLSDQRPVAPGLDLTVESIAEEINNSNGRGCGIGVPMDLVADDSAIERFLESAIRDKEGGRLDVLVCSAYTTPAGEEKLRGNFWEQSMDMWDAVNGLGLRSVYNVCRAATPYMIETAAATKSNDSPPPLICLVSSFGGKSYTFNVAYGVGKAGIDRLAVDASYQLAKHGVATTSLYPGLVKTEANLFMDTDEGGNTWDEASGGLDLALGETPAFSGKAVVALASLPKEDMMKRSGSVEVVAELAEEMGFTEDDGSRPPSIRSLRYLLPNFVFPQIEKESGGKGIPAFVKNNIPDVLLPWSVFSGGPPPEMDTR